MKNIPERQKDILSIISSLDISPTMYKNAVEKYHAITKFLNDYGIDADMYPQGSFAFGTVIRPNATNPSASYDLDFICQVRGSRVDYAPSELRQIIEEALSSSGIYGGKLTVYKECFTIEYADVNDIGFTIDIVPATDETVENKNQLIKKSLEPALIETAIAIPKYNGERNYSWLTNNPKGLRAWFDAKNEPFLAASRSAYRERLFAANRVLFASVEEIPHELDRSALQRVIQILKYHRDVFYAKIEDGNEIKPISAIINVVIFEKAESIFSAHLHDGLIQTRNTGHDVPPGVKDWYEFATPLNAVDAQFECQKQNIWWDKKMSHRKIPIIIFVGICIIVAFGFSMHILNRSIFTTLLCSSGIILKIFERLYENVKYIQVSLQIDGSKETIEIKPEEKYVEHLQSLIDERRKINVLELNSVHKKVAAKLSSLYNKSS